MDLKPEQPHCLGGFLIVLRSDEDDRGGDWPGRLSRRSMGDRLDLAKDKEMDLEPRRCALSNNFFDRYSRDEYDRSQPIRVEHYDFYHDLAFDFLPFETDGDFRFLDLGDGIRSRVGVRHVPLSELLNKLIASGLSLEHEEEPGEGAVPWLLAPVASKRVQKR
jgi:hypothetical protein